MSQTLGLQDYKDPKNTIRGSTLGANNNASSPFPTFDEQLLPHFAKLVRGIPGAFSKQDASSSSSLSEAFPWGLRGPLLNIDLKQGPHLTVERVLGLAQTIHDLQLEDYVAVCVMDNDGSHQEDVDLLQILHQHNLQRTEEQTRSIPLTLVLRDLVPHDANVEAIRHLVETVYPQSIKALVPSFKFPAEWFQDIRNPKLELEEETATNSITNELWKLPMTVWTIDSNNDYDVVSSLTTTTADTTKDKIPLVSAVVANSPMELVTTTEQSATTQI